MFSGTKYFETFPCPLFATGNCERPYCHFKHIKPDIKETAGLEYETENTVASNHPGYSTGTKTATPETAPFSIAAAAAGSSCASIDGGAAPAVDQTSCEPASVSATAAASTQQASCSPAAATPSPSMSAAALTAAMGPLAALTSVLEKDKLESMIQDAVRKVLLETGAASKLAAQPDLQTKVEVKEEADDDIIVEYCDINPNSGSQLKKENLAGSASSQSTSSSAESHRVGPRLCLPPPDTPTYIPTPIQELERRQSQQGDGVQAEGNDSSDNQQASALPSGLLAVGSLHTGERSAVTTKANSPGKKTFSYEPPSAPSNNVLGDIADMSESDEEEQNPDLLGSILKAGSSSGVLTGGRETNFEEQVIKERCKLLKKKLDKKEKSSKRAKSDENDDVLSENQCDKVTSSSQEKNKLTAQQSSDTEQKEITSEISSDSSEDSDDNRIKEEKEIIKSLEKKRLMLENFYKSKIKKLQDLAPEKLGVNEEESSHKKQTEKKKDSKSHKSHSSDPPKKKSSHKERERRKSSERRRHRSRERSRKHKRKHSSHSSDEDCSTERETSSRKSKSTKHSRHSRERHKSKKQKRSSSSEYSSESLSDTDISSESESKRKHKSSASRRKESERKTKKGEKEKNAADNRKKEGKHSNIEEENVIDPDTVDENPTEPENQEYEEVPDPEAGDEFKKAELKIKQLLEEKMKAPSMGIYSSYEKSAVKPEEKKIEAKLEPETDIPDVSVFLKPKPSTSLIIKPEIKLRSLTELADSESVIDPKTTNIFDHEEESFSEMIKRNEKDWMNMDCSSSTPADDNIAAEDNDSDERSANSSFLDAISATDDMVKKKAKDSKRDRSKSESRSRDKDTKRYKDKSRDDKSSRGEKEKHKSSDEKKKSSRSKDDRDKHRDRHSSSKDKKSSSSSEKRDRRSRTETQSKTKETKSHKEAETPFPDSTGELDDSSEIPDISAELDQLPDLDADLDAMFNSEDEDADDDELQRLFKEYKPDEKTGDPARAKLNKQVSSSNTKETDSSSKKRVAHDGANEHGESRRPLHMRKPQTKTPAQTMLERYRRIKEMTQNKEKEKQSSDSAGHTSTAEDPVPGPSRRVAHRPSPGSAAPAVLSKTKQQLLARQASTSSRYDAEASTVAQTTKGKSRVAHTPSTSAVAALAKPIITSDPNSKVPSNVRQRYLDSITTECLNIYSGDQSKAYPRAEKEEMDCCRKASSRMIYLNLVVNKIKKLRTEAKEAEESRSRDGGQAHGSGSTSGDKGKRSLLTTHMQVLAGRPGTIGTWSIEKPVKLSDEDIDEELMYNVMKKFMLSEQQLVDNGFPRTDPQEPGKAIVKVDSSVTAFRPSDPTRRSCHRCKTIYRVDKFGKQIDKEDCVYHWGRQHRQRGNRALGGAQTVFYCCQQGPDTSGCQVGKYHVTDVLDYNDMRGFVSTLERGKAASGKVFALDCEMCYTTQGNELTRVTVLDHSGEVIYETLVKPDNDIVDYNTRFSGITEEDLKDVTTTLVQVQAVLLMKFDAKDILIGHSLESDLKALKILHSTVVDTSVVFPHRMGPPFKRALKFLAADHLKRIIQSDEGGHDSKEDALACLDLMRMKVKEEVKRLQKKARLQAMYSNT